MGIEDHAEPENLPEEATGAPAPEGQVHHCVHCDQIRVLEERLQASAPVQPELPDEVEDVTPDSKPVTVPWTHRGGGMR